MSVSEKQIRNLDRVVEPSKDKTSTVKDAPLFGNNPSFAAAQRMQDLVNNSGRVMQLNMLDNEIQSALPKDSILRAGESPLQAKFSSPNWGTGTPVSTNFVNHAFTTPGGSKGNTACGVRNKIVTDGSAYSTGTSSAGDPTNLATYRDNFSQAGGLVRDKTAKKAATRMHLINHHLEDVIGTTQQNPGNIFMGTKRSNKAHETEVETPIKNAVELESTQQNVNYQNAIGAAKDVTHNSNPGLFWPNGGLPVVGTINPSDCIPNMWRDVNTDTVNVIQQNTTDVQGTFLETPANYDPGRGYRHFWVDYEVQANYGTRPGYVTGNITTESYWDANSNSNGRQADINFFDLSWSDNAFPPTFDNTALYYFASFVKSNPYYRQNEAQTLNADM